MTAILSEISHFDHFLNIVISDLWVNCKCQNNILKCFFVDLYYFLKFEVESKFCQKLKIFMTAVLNEFSDFDHFLNIVISELWVNCKYQNDILKCFFLLIWTICGSLRVSQILSKIENFHDLRSERNFRFWPLFEHCHFWLLSELQVWKWYSKVFFFGDLNYLWKFEIESKFCKKI